VALFAAVSLAAGLLAPAAADASSWASTADATIRPGVQLVSDSGQCTANFVFTDGTDVLIGSAAHCTGLGAATDTNGCTAGSLPRGSRVDVEGAAHPATLVYSSWLTMQERGERDADACRFNDFALLKLDSRDHARVNPTVPHWGGPVALGSSSTTLERVYSYGNSSLRLGLDLLKPKTGSSLGQGAGGWTHTVYTATPGIPGDSGSAFLDSQGRALGTLSTLALAPAAGSNGVTDLNLALGYANQHTNLSARLAVGTEPFDGSRLPVGGTADTTTGTGAPLGGEVNYSILGWSGNIRF
jgi:hypothetical protein